ncbi:MAG TPA: menaquinone-dependent protoporphyrinogen IX dehydrogenase [Burkholderiaceae bacterium]|nr:menaquinone-dependent protoporphyrinogen IX dehydrogenase [Burkholderiaceae bacterium]
MPTRADPPAMARVLILCSSTDGQTRKICERLRIALQQAGHAPSLAMIDDEQAPAPQQFAMVLIGARIRYGRTDRRVIAYANRHADALNAMPGAYFSVNIVARKPGKDRPETNPYVRKFLRRVAWRPSLVDVFAGRLDYPRYGVCDRLIIRFIMWLTGGPTAADAVVEYTDWRRVDAFGSALTRALAAG